MQILPLLQWRLWPPCKRPLARTTRSDPVLVRSVIDGDTIDVGGGRPCAAAGHRRTGNRPRLRHGRAVRARGAGSADALVLHRWVRLEQEGARARRLPSASRLRADRGWSVRQRGARARGAGAGVGARRRCRGFRELQRAEAEAQEFRRGMWGARRRFRRRVILGQSSGQPRRPHVAEANTPASKSRKTRKKKIRERYSCRVRLAAQDPRAQQAVLPVQSLADLDLRVLHRARAR